jgi:carbonic anhydrase
LIESKVNLYYWTIGQNVTLKSLSIRDLVPDDQSYMTYEGSLTMPACSETVTWIIINKVLSFLKSNFFN